MTVAMSMAVTVAMSVAVTVAMSVADTMARFVALTLTVTMSESKIVLTCCDYEGSLLKLDGVAPLISDPPPTSFTTFCHGPRRRLKAMALAPPCKGIRGDLSNNRQEQTCLHWPVD